MSCLTKVFFFFFNVSVLSKQGVDVKLDQKNDLSVEVKVTIKFSICGNEIREYI